jgi:hypothetical protein
LEPDIAESSLVGRVRRLGHHVVAEVHPDDGTVRADPAGEVKAYLPATAADVKA